MCVNLHYFIFVICVATLFRVRSKAVYSGKRDKCSEVVEPKNMSIVFSRGKSAGKGPRRIASRVHLTPKEDPGG